MRLNKITLLSVASLSLIACGGAPSLEKIYKNTNESNSYKMIYTYNGQDSVSYYDDGVFKLSDGDNADYVFKGNDGIYYMVSKYNDGWFSYSIPNEYLDDVLDDGRIPDIFDFSGFEDKFDYSNNTFTLKEGEVIETKKVYSYEGYDFPYYYCYTGVKIIIDNKKISVFELDEQYKETEDGEYGAKAHIKIQMDYSKQSIEIPPYQPGSDED